MSSPVNPIDETFDRLRKQGKKAFIPFLTAGDPDIATTQAMAQTVIAHGADLLEIGFPYSDPIADGPVIQASYTRALEKKLKVEQIWSLAESIRVTPEYGKHPIPLVAMVSFSLVHRQGADAFLARAKKAGFSGIIVPDLPWNESAEMDAATRRHDLKWIQLVTPTTPNERAAGISKGSGGFLYCVSVSGITGERRAIPAALMERLAWLKNQTNTPLCVGFGISHPDHAKTLKPHCDGVIVGSAIVRQLERLGREPLETVKADIASFCQSMRAALDT